MKKILCVVLMICMMMGAALAEETPALNWEDVVPVIEASGLSGQFYTFEDIAVKFWLPEGLNPVELSEEDTENGLIAYFMPDDESAAVSISYVNVDGASLEDYAAYLSGESDVTEVEAGTVNGFPCVSYKMPEKDSVNIAFTTELGYILEVSCTPVSEENAELVWGVVVASIQAAE